MSRGAFRPEMTGDARLAQARERFLTAEPMEPGQVRDTILASWRRSREWRVAADRHYPSYVRGPHPDTPPAPRPPPVLPEPRQKLEGPAVNVHLTHPPCV